MVGWLVIWLVSYYCHQCSFILVIIWQVGHKLCSSLPLVLSLCIKCVGMHCMIIAKFNAVSCLLSALWMAWHICPCFCLSDLNHQKMALVGVVVMVLLYLLLLLLLLVLLLPPPHVWTVFVECFVTIIWQCWAVVQHELLVLIEPYLFSVHIIYTRFLLSQLLPLIDLVCFLAGCIPHLLFTSESCIIWECESKGKCHIFWLIDWLIDYMWVRVLKPWCT
jgi:hypothetical protein